MAQRNPLPPHLEPVGKYDWLDLVLRLKIPTGRKTVAWAMARFAGTRDGSRVFPGQKKVADMAGMHETNVRTHVRALEALGLLHMARRGGGRSGDPHEYQLTVPKGYAGLPLWLDPDFDRLPEDGLDAEIRSLPVQEHRPPTVGETASGTDASAPNTDRPRSVSPVDNSADSPETPTAHGRHSDPADEEHRPPALDENDFHRPLEALSPTVEAVSPTVGATRTRQLELVRTRQDPAGLRKATNSLGDRVADVDNPEAVDVEFEASRELLAGLPLPERNRWRRTARTELESEGHRLTHRDVEIRAAEMITRPDLVAAHAALDADLDAHLAAPNLTTGTPR